MKLSAVAGAFLISMVASASAFAQCSFNAIDSGKMKLAFVRSVEGCPLASSNTETASGTAACTPVQAPAIPGYCALGMEDCFTNADCPVGSCVLPAQQRTSYRFGSKGRCTLGVAARVVPDCSAILLENGGLLAVPCSVPTLNLKCRGIERADGTPIDATDAGWTLRVLARVSMNDANGDLTMIDVPADYALPAAASGALSGTVTLEQILYPLIGPAGATLPPCSQIEFADLELRSGGGYSFARIGIGTR